MSSGPFSVSGAQVERLTPAQFTQFVNRLLVAEAAAHGMAGTSLETTYLDNVGDGGVDACLRHATATEWIPAGHSAWQFKSGDLIPSKCKTEIAGATRAQEILRAGGQYRLVLGKSLTEPQVAKRRDGLLQQIYDLGIELPDGAIEVIAADGLARWVENYPALAADPLLGGIGPVGQTFHQWASSNRHASNWTTSDSREEHIDDIRNLITGDGQRDLHIDGVSGLGKTRLVMEALRGQDYEQLVVYAQAADQFPSDVLTQMQTQRRTAVVVIDECDSKAHETYASTLPTDTPIRLITIGEPDGRSVRSPMLRLTGLEDNAMKKLLRQNEPSLWAEATNVIVEVVAGNIDYALKASRAVIAREATSAGALITEADIHAFITAELPDGALFLGCCVLALFSRVGFDAEVATELTMIAQPLGLDERQLRDAARALEQRGLLTRQGRYRAVGPQPIAVYLASQAWSQLGEAIVGELLSVLDPDMTERLFRRAAEIGDADTSRLAVERAMASGGIVGSWESLLKDGNAKLLVHLAVLAPTVTTVHLERLANNATLDELASYRSIRRDLVWTLEKLAWHSATFTAAADMLLRLALAEIEDYKNNATGTWIDLFGTMLPATAASPTARLAYLSEQASSDAPVRKLVVQAADRALERYGSIMVSGELQGGTVVEPRGTPKTYGEAWRYQTAMMDLLRQLCDDPDGDIGQDALRALVGSIHPTLEIETLRRHLSGLLSTLDGPRLREARMEIAHLKSLFDQASVDDGRVPGIEELEGSLPSQSASDKLWELAHARSWDWHGRDLVGALTEACEAVGHGDAVDTLLELLSAEELPAAYEIGRTLARLALHAPTHLVTLIPQLDGPNSTAIVGYLWELTDHGDPAAFDTFIDSLDAGPGVKLRLTVVGPRSTRAQQRVDELIDSVPVGEAAGLMFRWLRDVEPREVAAQLNAWLLRIQDQADYNAVVDLIALHLHGANGLPEPLQEGVARLIALRRNFPAIGQQGWDWAQLASRLLGRDPVSLAELLADLIDADVVTAYEGSQELQVLRAAVQRGGNESWTLLMDRIAAGSWRMNMAARGWLAGAVDIADARVWVSGDVARARVLASVASIRGEQLSDVGAYLLENFEDDDEVSSSLVGEFVSGSWVGNWSDRITGQIAQVKSWIEHPDLSQAVKKWARRLLIRLEEQRRQALQREAERDW